MKRLILILFLVTLPWCISWSSDDYDTRATADAAADASALSDASATASVTGGDQVISGGDTFAFSHGLGDVDIEGCVVTKQWGSILLSHQYFKYDVFCIADRLDVQGKHAAAAALRCSDKATKKLFGDSCISVWTFKPPKLPTDTATPNQGDEAPNRNDDDDDDDDHDVAYEALLKRVAKIEDEKDATVRRYNRDQKQRAEKEEARKLSAQSYLERLPPVQQQQQQMEEPPDGN